MAYDEDDDTGLPEELAPIRLPSVGVLADQAEATPLIGQMLALARWLGEQRRPVTPDGYLDGTGPAQAGAAIGVTDPVAFEVLWSAALATEFADLTDDERFSLPGPSAEDWAEGDYAEQLDIWEDVFWEVAEDAVEILADADPDLAEELNFSGQASAILLALYLAGGTTVDELSDLLSSTMSPDEGDSTAWLAWVAAHGNPVRPLLAQMTEAGAVQLSDSEDGEAASLTSLGLWAARQMLLDEGVDVPLLPEPEKMTAADLLAMIEGASAGQFDAEKAAWLTLRSAESAARELLDVAASDAPNQRLLAMSVVTDLGADAVPALRAVLDRPELSGYAKAALAAVAGEDDPELEPAEIAWLMTDMLVVDGWSDPDLDQDPVAERLGATIPAGTEEEAFEIIARIPHPQASHVLTVIGDLHPDKKVAKAARKAAYKATTRQIARGG